MTVAIGVKLEGADKLVKALAGMPRELKSAIQRSIEKSAYLIERESKLKTPRVYDPIGSGPSTGRLVGSIRTSLFESKAEIGTHVEYATYVHEGTSVMRARPFMKLGLEAASKDINEIVENEVERALNTIK
jgi:HK97 gp10 family phage protein